MDTIQIGNITVEIEIKGFPNWATVRYVEQPDNIEHVYTLKGMQPNSGEVLLVPYSYVRKVIGRDDIQLSQSYVYKDIEAGPRLNQMPMSLANGELLGEWHSKMYVNGLISRLEVLKGSEVNKEGTGYECYRTDGSFYQPVVLDDHQITTDSGIGDGSITISVLNGTGPFIYRLKQLNDTLTLEQGSNTFSDLPAGTYKLEVKDSLNAIRNTKFVIP